MLVFTQLKKQKNKTPNNPKIAIQIKNKLSQTRPPKMLVVLSKIHFTNTHKTNLNGSPKNTK